VQACVSIDCYFSTVCVADCPAAASGNAAGVCLTAMTLLAGPGFGFKPLCDRSIVWSQPSQPQCFCNYQQVDLAAAAMHHRTCALQQTHTTCSIALSGGCFAAVLQAKQQSEAVALMTLCASGPAGMVCCLWQPLQCIMQHSCTVLCFACDSKGHPKSLVRTCSLL
jgi:hypothetical protein